MANSFIKYAFVSGEISPSLLGRTDLEQYDLGMEKINNWFLDYRGGLSTRPGMEFVDEVTGVEERTKFFRFVFGPELEDTYLVVFDKGVIRFVQDGAYVLEAGKEVTELLLGVTTMVTAPTHGFGAGDLVYLNEVGGISSPARLFMVDSPGIDTFTLKYVNGQFVDSTGTTPYSGAEGTVQRVYGVPHPYTSEQLRELRAYQIRDTLRLTHHECPIRNLKRSGHTAWTLVDEEIGNDVTVPTGLVLTPSSSGGDPDHNSSVGFVVTAVNLDGVESLASNMKTITNIVNYTNNVLGHVTVTWDAVPNTKFYKVYRTIVLQGTAITAAEQVGFVGQTWAPYFVDNNIIPDFTQTPPIGTNPFAPLAIEHINITNGGSGYTASATVSVSGAGGTGTGFRGFPIVNAGKIIGVQIVNGGEGYVAPVTVTFTTGTGATATAKVTEATGGHPRVSTVFQQRQIYAGSDNDPLTLWGSVPGQFSNFDTSAITGAGDAFELEVDSAQVAPIEHLIVARGGLLVLSQYAIWQIQGSDGPVTPTNAVAEPQNFTGCGSLPPIIADTDMIHLEGMGTTVHLLGYNDITKVYSGQEISLLSNHLFPSTNKMEAWDWADDPYKVLWGCREDGSMLTFTFFKEQKLLYGWAPSSTQGLVTDVCMVPENDVSRIYLMVKRKLGGRWVKMIERVALRDFAWAEDAWCVDSGLGNVPTAPAATLTPLGLEGEVPVLASAGVFEPGDVGKVLRAGGGKGTVTAVGNATSVTVAWDPDRPVTQVIPETGEARSCPEGTWTLDETFTSVRGLWHLAGETVQILADGNVMPERRVEEDGTVALDAPASRVVVGLKFRPVARTLPLTTSQAVIENRRKRVVEIAARVTQSRGLKWGPTLDPDDLMEVKERTDEAYGAPIRLHNDIGYVILNSGFDDGGQVWFVQDNPLPATVTGLVLDVEVGDDQR